MRISLLPAKISQKLCKIKHAFSYVWSNSSNFCYLWCLFHFFDPHAFSYQSPGSLSSLTLTQLPDCYCRWVLLQRHQHGAGKAQGSQPLPPPPEIMTHVQTTTGVPEVRGRDKWQKGWLMISLQLRGGRDAEPESGQTPHSEGYNETKVCLR